jgi:hypothetical protein
VSEASSIGAASSDSSSSIGENSASDKEEEVESKAQGLGMMGLVKGKCALGPFLSILVIECQHKCLNVNLYPWMDKVQIKSKGMFLSLSTLVLCTNILV